MTMDTIYELMDIIKKKEERISLTKEESDKMKAYYAKYVKEGKKSMRLSKKGTTLYDLSLIQYLYSQVPYQELTTEDRRKVTNFCGNQTLRFMTDVIRKTSEKEKLGRFELMKLREIRRDLVRTKKLANTLAYLKNKRIDPNPPKVSEVKKIYGNRFTNDFVGGNYLEMFNVLYNEYESILTEEEKINFRLFKILLDTKNKTVHLSDLYKLTYKNIYSPEEIERRISNPEELSKFFDKLNGCLLEETVANIDLKNMDISNLGTIKVDYGTDIDPLVLVKAITPVPMVQVNDQPEQEMTFVIFSDVHLDQNCYREENGIMVVDSEKLNRNLSAFAEFKKGLVKSLGGVSGIIYTGDVLDGFFDKNKGRITVKTISNLSGEFVRFARKRKIAKRITNLILVKKHKLMKLKQHYRMMHHLLLI